MVCPYKPKNHSLLELQLTMQRGEQTINRDAKTLGGIKSFAADSSAILKWTLNRAEQAENTKALLDFA